MNKHLQLLLAFLAVTSSDLCADIPGYLAEAFQKIRWVAYSPTGKSAMPDSVEGIKLDLKTLHQAGFGGIVTYGCDGLKGEIPKLAHDAGIEFVILGLFDPANENEWKHAKALAHDVDGYCVGNEGIGKEKRYTLDMLRARMDELRKWSGRPVTTSEQIEDYSSIPELLTLGDWLFPNVHPFWNGKTTEPDASKWTKERVDELRARAQGRPILCKEVGMPTRSLDEGVKLPDEQVQAEYFQALRVHEVPFVYFEAFDQVWKRHHPAEPYWGIFTADRKPKKIGVWLKEPPPPPVNVRITSVQDKGRLKVRREPEGGFFEVEGSSGGIDDLTLLFFINTGDPAATGWFLQVAPNGVIDRDDKGAWTARGQIGNREYPPRADQKVSLKVFAVTKEEAKKLTDARLRNEQMRNSGIYSQDLPKVPAELRHEVIGLELDLQRAGK